MKSLLVSLRVLIAAGSLTGFIGAWALLAHSGKPVDAGAPPAAQVSPAPLRPQDLIGRTPTQLQPLPSFNPPRFSPRLRTGGS